MTGDTAAGDFLEDDLASTQNNNNTTRLNAPAANTCRQHNLCALRGHDTASRTVVANRCSSSRGKSHELGDKMLHRRLHSAACQSVLPKNCSSVRSHSRPGASCARDGPPTRMLPEQVEAWDWLGETTKSIFTGGRASRVSLL
jgi:hypothetical protein